MKYLSGLHALKLRCSLNTHGYWKDISVKWKPLPLSESDGSIWGEYGIEENQFCHGEYLKTANHIRAALDLLNNCEFDQLNGIGINLFEEKAYIIEFFEKALLLKDHPGWKEISGFLSDEFQEKWCVFLKNKNMQ